MLLLLLVVVVVVVLVVVVVVAVVVLSIMFIMYLLLINWEKAFDKVDQERFIFALERMGITQKIIGLIKTIYEKPNFAVKDRGRTSTRRRQRAGITQGCPLSPYLFGILMTVRMKDVEHGLTEIEKIGLRQGTPQRTGINKVFYADDTILLTTTKQSMESLLHSIEWESAKYNMRLNKQKCVVLNMNEIMRVEYSDGTQVLVKHQAVYLGAIITKKSEYKPE